ncbi:hypothetical protein [Paracoccus sp. ME4]|uniref:hypothetical protein n=1 Tax=Paracoccus sp. ME4 TaxID=3138066 RepID=UPI00398BBA6D
MSYLHHYPMLLEVPGMIEDTTVGLSGEKVAAALRAMADRVEKGSPDLAQLLGRGPVACEKEDRWVWRSIDSPKVVMKATGGWVEVEPDLIDLEDSCDSMKAASLLIKASRNAPANLETAIWARPENIGGTPIILEMRDEPDGLTFRTDISDFLAFADAEAVRDLAEADWGGPDQGQLMEWLREDNDPAVSALMLRQSLDPELDGFFESGVSVRVSDPDAAARFVEACRPGLLEGEGPRP